MGFKEYMRLEVHLARTKREPELFGTIARRLGVSRDSAVRWDDEWRRDVARGKRPAISSVVYLERGRLARLVQARSEAPYVISSLDEEWFVQASVGEMKYFLAKREFRNRDAALEMLAHLADRSVPMVERDPALQAFGEQLRAAFHQELKLSPGPAASGGSPRATP